MKDICAAGTNETFAFQLLLTNFKELATKFFEENYYVLLSHIKHLSNSPRITSRLHSMKLLRMLLFQPDNKKMKKWYFDNEDNLKFIMQSLEDNGCQVRDEAYLIFQAMLHEPVKSDPVAKILHLNQTRIEAVIKDFTELAEQRENSQS